MASFKYLGRLSGAAVGALVLGLSAARPALADEPGVARLSVVSGDVAIRRGDSSNTYAATVNAPLMASDYLSTGAGPSRAEVQFDYGNFLRLGNNVQMRLSRIDTTGRTIQLAEGTVELSELHAAGAAPEIDTPSIAVRAEQPGQYRVTVNHDGSTLVTVRAGSVTLSGTSVSQTLYAGQSVAISGAPASPQFQSIAVVAYDDFDSWNQSRDAFDGNDAGYQYANTQITGIPDLQSYGTWADSSQYGYGWTPNNVGSNWSPYQNGQWVWEPYYGYTWVGNEPWGWAPYHYGTWLYNSNAWTWYPNAGPQYPSGPYPYVGSGYADGYNANYGYNNYPYYGSGYPPYSTGYPYGYGYPYATTNTSSLLWAPAMVTFLGLLGGQNIDSALLNGAGSLAWTPLAPGEMAYPWYGPQQAAWYGYPGYGAANYQTYAYGGPGFVQGSQRIVNSYTTYNITKIVKIYRNVRAPHGVMVVNARAFRNGEFRTIRAESIAAAHIGNVAVFRNVVPVTPTASVLRFTSRPGPTRIAAIAPRVAMFNRFPAPAVRPTQFATVQSHYASSAQKLYAAHPAMPGPVLARKTLTAPKPPASAMRTIETPARRPVTTMVRKPETTTVRKPEVTTARKPEAPATVRQSETGRTWQQYDQVRGNSYGATKPAPEHVAAPQRQIAPERQVTPERQAVPQHVSQPERVTRPESETRPAPAHQYSAPERQYSAPERQYTAPAQRQYSAPAQRPNYERPSQARPNYERQQEHHPAPAQQRSAPSKPAGQQNNGGHGGNNNSNHKGNGNPN